MESYRADLWALMPCRNGRYLEPRNAELPFVFDLAVACGVGFPSLLVVRGVRGGSCADGLNESAATASKGIRSAGRFAGSHQDSPCDDDVVDLGVFGVELSEKGPQSRAFAPFLLKWAWCEATADWRDTERAPRCLIRRRIGSPKIDS